MDVTNDCIDTYGNMNNISVIFDTNTQIESHKLMVLSIKNINTYINNVHLPKQFEKWKNLQYLSLIGSNINNINSMCNFTQLQYLSLENSTNINKLPFDCIYNNTNLSNIKYVNLNGINIFDAQIFKSKTLKQYVHYYGDIVIEDFIGFNVNTFNNKTDYYLQGTSLCINYNNTNNNTDYNNIYNWINKTQSCYIAYNLNICPPMKWRNGICDNIFSR